MANYFQRIAISGSRTTSTVKPSAIWQTLMPPINQFVRPLAVEEEPQASDESLTPESRPGRVWQKEPIQLNISDLAPSEKNIVESITPSDLGGPIEPGIFDSTVVAPKGLRRARTDNSWPQEIARLFEGAISSATTSDTQSKAQKTEASVSVDSTSVQISPPVSTHNAEIKFPGKTGYASTRQPQIQMISTEKQTILEPRLLEIQPTKHKQTVLPLTSNVPDKRQRSQISIGKIDVQVNNLSAPEPAKQEPTSQSTRSNLLEGHYLNRFSLKF